jgi:hypothetical protein
LPEASAAGGGAVSADAADGERSSVAMVLRYFPSAVGGGRADGKQQLERRAAAAGERPESARCVEIEVFESSGGARKLEARVRRRRRRRSRKDPKKNETREKNQKTRSRPPSHSQLENLFLLFSATFPLFTPRRRYARPHEYLNPNSSQLQGRREGRSCRARADGGGAAGAVTIFACFLLSIDFFLKEEQADNSQRRRLIAPPTAPGSAKSPPLLASALRFRVRADLSLTTANVQGAARAPATRSARDKDGSKSAGERKRRRAFVFFLCRLLSSHPS